MKWRGLTFTCAAAATFFACSDAYEEDVAPMADAGSEASASPADSGVDAPHDGAVAPPDDADADAAVNPCDPGYEPGGPGAPCQIANPFEDPSFQTGMGWTAVDGAQILTTTAGPDDIGVGRVTGKGYSWGRVKQTITLPDSFANLPLAITATGNSENDTSGVGYFPFGMTSDGRPLFLYDYGLNGAGVSPLHADICIGEAVLYGPHEFAFRGNDLSLTRVDIDHVELVREASCPKHGVIANGDFESGGGWDIHSPDVAIVAGALKFKTPTTSSAGTAHQMISVPSVTMKYPALQLRVIGAASYFVAVEGYVIAHPQAAGPEEVKTICMPEFARGIVVDLEIGAGGDGLNLEGAEKTQTFSIDDVLLKNDPTCAQPNRDFEKADPTIPDWYLLYGNGYSITRGTASPHQGTGFLRLASNSASCGPDGGSYAHAFHRVRIPDYDPAKNGPRLTFWYRHDPGANGASTVMLDYPLTATATWTSYSRCLYKGDPPGARVDLRFDLQATAAGCTSSTLDIDDVVVDVDESCKD